VAGTLPTGRNGRLLALALVLVAAAVLWAGVAAPLTDLYAAQAERLAQRQALLQRMQVLAGDLPRLRDQASHVDETAEPTIGGASDALAAAKLQDLVQDAATNAGTALSSVETLPAEPAGGYRRLALRISFDADLEVLATVMQNIEQSRPPLLIDDLQIRAEPNQQPGGRGRLAANLTVVAFRAAEAQ
jgi:general secretion pathway protein M